MDRIRITYMMPESAKKPPIVKEMTVPAGSSRLEIICLECHPHRTIVPFNPRAKHFAADGPRRVTLERHLFVFDGQRIYAFVGQCFCGQVFIVNAGKP